MFFGERSVRLRIRSFFLTPNKPFLNIKLCLAFVLACLFLEVFHSGDEFRMRLRRFCWCSSTHLRVHFATGKICALHSVFSQTFLLFCQSKTFTKKFTKVQNFLSMVANYRINHDSKACFVVVALQSLYKYKLF